MRVKDPSKASRAGAAQRLADKRDQARRMAAFYDYFSQNLRSRVADNLRRRAQMIMDRPWGEGRKR